jgi:hypothetical protein
LLPGAELLYCWSNNLEESIINSIDADC